MEQTGEKKRKKMNPAKRIAVAFLLLIIFLLLYAITMNLSGKIPQLFGFSIFRIASPSMEPTLPVGTYIVTRRVAPEDVRVDDIITFYTDNPDPAIAGFTLTHRVTQVIASEDGTFEFVMQGDNNPGPDEYNARGERMVGVYVRTVYILTAFGNALQTKAGFFVAVVIPLFVLLRLGIRDFTRATKKKQMDDLVAQEVERMKTESKEKTEPR